MSEKQPSRAMGALLEGRVILIVDGTPFVLIVPVTFTMFLT
ncbi:MAG TPA: spore germination protein, partial [Bacillota bacterium]|nr:spore germination protein [Bacillota bacterium]